MQQSYFKPNNLLKKYSDNIVLPQLIPPHAEAPHIWPSCTSLVRVYFEEPGRRGNAVGEKKIPNRRGSNK
jgi:hypothetical protein